MDKNNLVAWLPFDTSTTADKCGNSWTAYGTPTIENGAIHLPSGAYLTTENIIDLSVESKWTFLCKCKRVTSSGDEGFFGIGDGGTGKRGIVVRSDGIYVDVASGSGWQAKTSTIFPSQSNVWCHLAIVKNGGSLLFFEDGQLVWTATITAKPLSNGRLTLGGNSYGYTNDIYLDEVLFYDGVALHTENFTPPTADDYFRLAMELDGYAPISLDFDVERKVSRSRKPVAQYVSFTGNAGSYGLVPLGVLAGATTFTIEVKFSTTTTYSSNNNYDWKTIIGREIQDYWQNDFGLCVNNSKLCFWAEPKSGGSNSTHNTTSSATVNDGKIHKAAVVSNADGSINLYCDGELVAHTDNVNAKITDSYQIGIASNINNASKSIMQMDFCEARFWSIARTQGQIFADIQGDEAGLEAWYIPNGSATLVDGSINGRDATLYGSPAYTYVDIMPIDLSFDVVRRVFSPWRYVNAGTADTLTISGTTLTDLPESKSITGTAFYQTQRVKCFDIPATAEIWIKFDLYHYSGTSRFRVYDDKNGSTANGFVLTQNSSTQVALWSWDGSANYQRETFDGVLKANTLQTWLLHMVSGANSGLLELWCDGSFVGAYSGNVNNGEDFANVYLQTDNANNLFSNVIISNTEIELGEGWQIFTFDVEKYDFVPVDATFDVVRNVVKPIIVPVIMDGHFCHVVRDLWFEADTVLTVILPRKCTFYISGVVPDGFIFTNEADRDVWLNSDNHDTSPDVESLIYMEDNIACWIEDTDRIFLVTREREGVECFEIIISDFETNPSSGTYYITSNNTAQEFFADVERELINFADFNADVEFGYHMPFNLFGDVSRNIKANINLYKTDTSHYFSGGSSAPIVIPTQEVVPPATDSEAVTQSIEITIAEQQITDQVKVVTAIPLDIMYPVQGQYLDYYCDMRVERVSKQGVLYTADCCSDLDALLYTQLAYTLKQKTTWYQEGSDGEEQEIETYYPPASEHVEKIANALGLTPVMQFDNFLSTLLFDDLGGLTYADIIRDVFGWSSRVPHMLINCYIRNGKLFVIQRGHEANVIDISGADMTLPIYTHELVRTTWGSSPNTSTETREQVTRNFVPADSIAGGGTSSGDDSGGGGDDSGDDSEEEKSWLNVGSVTVSDSSGTTTTTYSYDSNGILRRTVAVFTSRIDSKESSTTTTTNSYNSDKLLSKTEVDVSHPYDHDADTLTITTYGYKTLANNQKFLSTEMVTMYENGKWVDTRVTTKSPTGRGQGATTDNSGNTDTGGNISDDRATPYSEKKAAELIKSLPENATDSDSGVQNGQFVDGVSLYDSSFPIHDTATLIRLTEALKWLNRKTRETVTLSIYNFPHLIDFNDRVVLFGNEYYLVSNRAHTNARIYNEQALTLVRWY